MISDYFFYLACVIGFLLIVRVLYVYEKNYEQFKKELSGNDISELKAKPFGNTPDWEGTI